ncbi:MAG TPA: hypothetical protein VL572_04300 [Pyrinomonadaceae bacterium]|jgi:hypothetical protein|nr:hypothetical protein [Pyrinomonadaceae bacterium]HVQ56339.1 hypothetical protein [Pyrinomonadaceae bacterium]
MNKFWNIVLSLVMVIGLSVAVSAQRGNDQKKPPPKGDSPKVEPREKPPPRNNPRGGDKPKKPGSGFALVWRNEEIRLA